MLKKDLLTLCLLHLLMQSDRYGYEMLSCLHGAFPDTQESAVYALLRELCRNGCTENYHGSVSGGPTRKYYRITATGRAAHADLLTQWQSMRAAMSAMGID